ncbi:hypothetical protein J6590_041916 [Homalodisca vitripennis]|nr:hypothetical protein J6590_041916 [Homalodisca vitripennis]
MFMPPSPPLTPTRPERFTRDGVFIILCYRGSGGPGRELSRFTSDLLGPGVVFPSEIFPAFPIFHPLYHPQYKTKVTPFTVSPCSNQQPSEHANPGSVRLFVLMGRDAIYIFTVSDPNVHNGRYSIRKLCLSRLGPLEGITTEYKLIYVRRATGKIFPHVSHLAGLALTYRIKHFSFLAAIKIFIPDRAVSNLPSSSLPHLATMSMITL